MCWSKQCSRIPISYRSYQVNFRNGKVIIIGVVLCGQVKFFTKTAYYPLLKAVSFLHFRLLKGLNTTLSVEIIFFLHSLKGDNSCQIWRFILAFVSYQVAIFLFVRTSVICFLIKKIKNNILWNWTRGQKLNYKFFF